jgi:hypothetical protein
MKLKDLVKAQIREDVADEATETATEPSTDGVKLSDIWDEQGSNAVTYLRREQFAVKQINNEFEVYTLTVSERKFLEKVSQSELDAKYLRVGKTPVEGFITYTLNPPITAFQYVGDVQTIKNGDKTASLLKDDYIVKQPHGKNKFTFEVYSTETFEAKYVERT